MTSAQEKLASQVREGGIQGHMAFDELASIANGHPGVREIFKELEEEIALGEIILEPYPSSTTDSFFQRLVRFIAIPLKDVPPPDNW